MVFFFWLFHIVTNYNTLLLILVPYHCIGLLRNENSWFVWVWLFLGFFSPSFPDCNDEYSKQELKPIHCLYPSTMWGIYELYEYEEGSYVAVWYSDILDFALICFPGCAVLRSWPKTATEAHLLVVRGAGELLASILQSGGEGESRSREVEGSLFIMGHVGNC